MDRLLAAMSEGVGLIECAVSFKDFQLTSKIPALRAGILLGISYRIQIGLAYCNGPKGAGRG